MPAAATARKPAATTRTPAKRRAPTRRATPGRAPARRPQAAPRRRIVSAPVVAVSGIADSGVVVRLTRGRLWIGVLATLLVGIVALNVGALQLSAGSSKAARQSDALKRQNSALRAELAGAVSSERMQRTASKLGLAVPEPGSIRYVTPSPGDAASAAKRLRDGELAATSAAPAVPIETPPAGAVATEEATTNVPPASSASLPGAGGSAEGSLEPPSAPAEITAPPTEPAAPAGGVVSP